MHLVENKTINTSSLNQLPKQYIILYLLLDYKTSYLVINNYNRRLGEIQAYIKL
jgi:hypothetical protein